MYKVFYIVALFMISLFAQTNPLHVKVDIYSNASFITKSFQIKSQGVISLKLPAQTNLENISIKTKNCNTSNLSLSNPKKFKNQEIEKLTIKIEDLNNQITSLKEKNNLLKTLSLKDKKGKEISTTLDYFSKNFMQDIRSISDLKIKLRAANERLKMLQNQKASQYKNLHISFTCRDKGIMKVTYPEYNFRIRHFYDIKANSNTLQVQFIKKIKIIQKTGEDFENLDIYAHSNAYNQSVAPMPFYPKYLNFYPKKRVLMSKSMPVAMENTAINAKSIYRENLTTSSFVALLVKIKNNQEKIVELDKQIKNIKFQNDIDGYGTSRAYLKAKFKSDRYYQSAQAYIYLDNNQVGTRRLPNIKKDAKVSLYFGKNQNIKIKKTLQRRFSESEFFGSKQINTQVWQYKISNVGKTMQKINLIERLPISQNEDIKVEPLFDTKKAKIDKKGKTIWSFNLAPSEIKTIKFGYKTTKPKK